MNNPTERGRSTAETAAETQERIQDLKAQIAKDQKKIEGLDNIFRRFTKFLGPGKEELENRISESRRMILALNGTLEKHGLAPTKGQMQSGNAGVWAPEIPRARQGQELGGAGSEDNIYTDRESPGLPQSQSGKVGGRNNPAFAWKKGEEPTGFGETEKEEEINFSKDQIVWVKRSSGAWQKGKVEKIENDLVFVNVYNSESGRMEGTKDFSNDELLALQKEGAEQRELSPDQKDMINALRTGNYQELADALDVLDPGDEGENYAFAQELIDGIGSNTGRSVTQEEVVNFINKSYSRLLST